MPSFAARCMPARSVARSAFGKSSMPLCDMNALKPITPQSRELFESVEIARHQPAPEREVHERLALGDGALRVETPPRR